MHFQTTSARLDQMQDHLQDLIRCTRRHHLQDLIRCNTICKTWSDALADTICKTWSDARPSAFTWSDALADTMCKTSCTPTRTLPRQAIWSDKCYNILINATKVRFWFKTSRSKQSSCCVHVPLNPKQYSLNSVSTADYSLLTTTTVCSQQLQFAWCIWNANLHWLLTFFHLARIIYIRCIYGIFGRGITKYTVYIYGFGQPYTFSYILVPFFGHRTASGLTNV